MAPAGQRVAPCDRAREQQEDHRPDRGEQPEGAVLAASILHNDETTVAELKGELAAKGLEVRP